MSELTFEREVGSMPHRAEVAGVGIALTAIWVAVALTSVFSPDMISGIEQQHLPIAALINWFWGSVATALVLIAVAIGHARRLPETHEAWLLIGLVTTAIWGAVTVVSIAAPRMVTGTDPTHILLAAMISPVVGTAATGFLTWAIALLSPGSSRTGPGAAQ